MAVHLAKGTRDFLPAQMHHRLAVIQTLRSVFTRFGFEPLETPAFERIETLTGKYGDEGNQLIFRILKRGKGGEQGACDQALRYDLTVPLARVMAMHPELRLPFKRYQIQPVWRADRPARGRFREFWQCDVDICGSSAPIADAECLAVVAASLDALGFKRYRIRLNDRRILGALAAALGAAAHETGVLVAIDKLDKIGRAGVEKELRALGVDEDGLVRLWQLLELGSDDEQTLDKLAAELDVDEAVATLREVRRLALELGVRASNLCIDPTLARGLDYYTGPVFETVVDEPKIGAISGGGRYDGLIGMFSGRAVPAVGVSLGMERIVAVMEELGMSRAVSTAARVLITVMGPAQSADSIRTCRVLRDAGIPAELYLGSSRLKAQLKYANARGYPYIVVIGEDEVAAGMVMLRDMAGGGQEMLSLEALVGRLQS